LTKLVLIGIFKLAVGTEEHRG